MGQVKMKIVKRFIAAVCLGLLFTGCITPPPKMESARGSVLAISVKIKPPVPINSFAPLYIYFARVDEKKDLKNQSDLLLSNYNYADNYSAYVFNVPPGTYIAVAALYLVSKDDTQMVLLPKDLVEKSLTKVEAGGFAYMGTYTVKKVMFSSLSTDTYDDYQQHYYKRLSLFKNRAAEFFLDSAYNSAVLVSAEKKAEDEIGLIKSIMSSTEKTEWLPLLVKRLEELKGKKSQ